MAEIEGHAAQPTATADRPRTRTGAFLAPLEGLRGLAAIGVVAVHVAIFTGDAAAGWNGKYHSTLVARVTQPFEIAVPFFCVIAGLLLYRQFSNTALRGDRMQAIGPYLWRRALRILPLYWTVVTVALVAANPGRLHSAWDWLRPYFFLQIYKSNQWGTADLPYGLVPTWSLASEAVFYLVLPPLAIGLAALAARRGGDLVARAKTVLAGIGVLLVLNVAWVVYTHLPSQKPWPVPSYWLPSIIGFFGAGMGLAILSSWAKAAPDRVPGFYRVLQRRPAILWWTALASLVGLAVPQLVGLDPNTANYPTIGHAVTQFLLNLVCAVSVVAAVVIGERPSRLLTNAVAQLGGRLSYGVYLWHEVILVSYYYGTKQTLGTGSYPFVLALTLVLSFGFAWLTYRLVERPAQKLRPRLGRATADYRATASPEPVGAVPEPVTVPA